MKALVKKLPERGLWLEEVPVPKPKAGELLMRVHKAAICGTDLHIYKWDAWAQSDAQLPVTVGHEFVGEVVELGAGVRDWSVGDRICAEGHIYCGSCLNCRTGKAHLCMGTYEAIGRHIDGGFAEYVALPAKNAIAIPKSISDDAAALLDPLGNAVLTANSFDLFGRDVVITGSGPIGCMGAAVCRAAGARSVTVTDVNPKRLAMAKEMGATRTIDVSSQELDGLFTVALEMSGAPAALESLIDKIAPGGDIALLGVLPDGSPIDWTKVIFKAITLKGIYGREIFRTWFESIGILEAGLDLSPIITHRFSLEEFEQAFETALSGEAGKVVLEINS